MIEAMERGMASYEPAQRSRSSTVKTDTLRMEKYTFFMLMAQVICDVETST